MAKNSSNHPDYSREREFKVLLEEIQSQFRTFGEGQVALTQKVDKLAQKVDGLDQKVERIELQQLALTHKFEGLEQKVERLEQKVEGLEHQMKTGFAEVHTKLDRFFVVLSDHETRISKFESAGR